MRIITPNEDNLIFLGKVGENEAVQVVLDVSEILSAFGDGGNFVLTNMRSEDTLGYPVIVTRDGSSVVWTVQSIDLAYVGEGKLEVTYYLGDTIAKSITYPTYVCSSVTGGAEPPDPWKPIIDEILQARDEAVEAAGNAAESERNASASERAASQSESNAHGSELAAGGSASSAETSALKSEGYAVGKQNGTPVESGSPYYKNNAAYYAAYANEKAEEVAQALGPINAHIADHNNPHSVTKAQVGLGNADNTSDLDKPISTATQAALDGKISKVAGAVADNIAVLTAGGEVADSGIARDWLVPVKAKSGSVIEFTSDGAVPLKSALIKGKTAAVNQILQNGDFADSSGWATINASFSVSGGIGSLLASAQSGQVGHTIYGGVAGHTYFVAVMLKTAAATTQIQVNPTGMDSWYINTVASTDWQVIAGIRTATTSGNKSLTIIDRRQSGWDAIQVKNAIFIDLTLCGFTSEETADVATLKAAWLAKYGTPLPQYIPYNAGSLVSNNATYQLCGHNIWDEEWEAGGIDSATGANASSSVRFRSKNYIPCKPNTTLYYKRGTGDYSSVFFYDANKNYLGASAAVTKTASGTFTVPDGACYLRFYVNGTTTYGNDLAINYPATVTTYEPFHDGGSITADSLNGIGTVADEQDATGHIDRRFTEDDLSTLTFSTRYTGSVNKTLSANLTDQYIGYPATEFLALSDKYLIRDMVGGAANLSDPDNKDVGIYWYGKSGSTTDRVIYIVCPVADTPSGNIVYRKATPTTDTTTPATLTTQKGYNILRTVSGDIQNAPADIEYFNGLAAVIVEALQ